jgi:hypothetical protein
MYTTFKRLLSKHTVPENVIAWKGFLLGVIMAILIIGPIVTVAFIFIFNEYIDVDEAIIRCLDDFVYMMCN